MAQKTLTNILQMTFKTTDSKSYFLRVTRVEKGLKGQDLFTFMKALSDAKIAYKNGIYLANTPVSAKTVRTEITETFQYEEVQK